MEHKIVEEIKCQIFDLFKSGGGVVEKVSVEKDRNSVSKRIQIRASEEITVWVTILTYYKTPNDNTAEKLHILE
jgi:hypothetical protein